MACRLRTSTTWPTAAQDDPDTASTNEATIDAAADKPILTTLDNALVTAGHALGYGFAYTTSSGTKDLHKGDTVKVLSSGLVYRFIGSSGTGRNLATQAYTSDPTNWERVLPQVMKLSDTSWQVVGGTDVYIITKLWTT